MKRVIILHCWGGVPDSRWYPGVKLALENTGQFEVEIPEMPNTDHPKLGLWLKTLVQTIGTPDQDLYLVGHSVGVPVILRYLETLPSGLHVGGVVSVAGYTDGLEDVELVGDKSVLPPFFVPPLDWNKIRESTKEFVAIYSDNDPYVSTKYADIFKDKLGAKLILKKGMGHFSEPDGDGDKIIVKELPDVVSEIIRISTST